VLFGATLLNPNHQNENYFLGRRLRENKNGAIPMNRAAT